MCLLQNSSSSQAAPPQAPLSEETSGNWQDKYADPEWRNKITKLSPEEEAKFQEWAAKNKAPITEDYDMRGFWKYGGGESSVNRNDGKLHFTDTYKTPLHESFSGESKYSRKDVPGPKWNERDQLVSPEGRVLFDEPAMIAKRRMQGK